MIDLGSLTSGRVVRVLIATVLLWALACSKPAPDAAGDGDHRQAAAPASTPPESHPPLVDSRGNPVPAGPAGAAPAEAGLLWTAPPAWVSEPPASSMRKAQYSLPPAAGDAEPGQCAVFYFGSGQGGEVRANIDRWAGQFADAAGGHPSPQITEGTVSGMKVTKVVAEGTYTPSPMMGGDTTPKPGSILLGAIVEGPEANWFFKCTGPKKTMEARRKEFDALIESIHTP
jgi:hypothetical protein